MGKINSSNEFVDPLFWLTQNIHEIIEKRKKEILDKRVKRLDKIKKIIKKDETSYQAVQTALSKMCEIDPFEKDCINEYESPFQRYDVDLLDLYVKNPYEEYDRQKKAYEHNGNDEHDEHNEHNEHKNKKKKETEEKEKKRKQKREEMEARQKSEATNLLKSIFL